MVKYRLICWAALFSINLMVSAEDCIWVDDAIAVHSCFELKITSVERVNFNIIQIKYTIINKNSYPVAIHIPQLMDVLNGKLKICFKDEYGIVAHYNPTQRRIIDRNGNVRLAIRTYKAEWNGDYTIHNSVLVFPNERYNSSFLLDYDKIPSKQVSGNKYDVYMVFCSQESTTLPSKSEYPYYYVGDLKSNIVTVNL